MMVRWAIVAAILATLFFPGASFGQPGFDDDRFMLQGFYWESYVYGDPDPRFAKVGTKRWYQIVKEQAGVIRDGDST